MNSDRIAVRRRLRVRGLLWRSCSRCSRKRAISGSSRSSQSSAEGCLPVVVVDVAEQQPQRVAVGRDRARAGLQLARQPVGEERLQRRRDERHGQTACRVVERAGRRARAARAPPTGRSTCSAGSRVAEIGRQPRQPALDVDAGAIPVEQGANGERMPEVVDPRRDRARRRRSPASVAEPAEDRPDALVDDAACRAARRRSCRSWGAGRAGGGGAGSARARRGCSAAAAPGATCRTSSDGSAARRRRRRDRRDRDGAPRRSAARSRPAARTASRRSRPATAARIDRRAWSISASTSASV